MNRSLQKIDFKRSVGNTPSGRVMHSTKSNRHWGLTTIVGVSLVLTFSAISANTIFNESATDKASGQNAHQSAFNPNIVDKSSDARNGTRLISNPKTVIAKTTQAPAVTQRSFSQASAVNRVQAVSNVKRISNNANEKWTTIVIEKGDNLTTIFQRIGLSPLTAMQLGKIDDAKQLTRIQPGQALHVLKDGTNNLLQIRYAINTFETLEIKRADNGTYNSDIIKRTPNIEIDSIAGSIESNLSMAAAQSGLPDKTLYDLISIFGWQVDFAKDIQAGDRFAVIYEKLILDGKHIGNGDIIAAELTSNGNTMRAIRHKDSSGDTNYYTPEGEALKGSFLRTPMRFARVTSRFTTRRFHPVLKRWRSHKGVDYGAPTGTPILTTGDGVVQFAGRKGGYGNVVIVRHGRGYETLYAHMSKFGKGVKVGSRVNQGQVIGYVGSTGLATGPHLHYEFRINGNHVNPLTVKLPKAEPVPKKYKQQFITQSTLWTRQLDRIESGSSVNSRIVQADNSSRDSAANPL